jgi:hypothetical protein
VQIHYFAAARQARGVAMENLEQDFSTLDELIAWLNTNYTGNTQAGSPLAEVLEKCSFLVNGHHASRTTALPNNARVDILPPFAGG